MAYYLDNTELFFFNEGNSAYAYKSLGCHRKKRGQKEVWRFAVWAPNARAVSVIGTNVMPMPTAMRTIQGNSEVQ